MKERLALSKDWLVERNATVMATTPFVRMDDTMLAEYENCAQTFKVLQQFTEGHNLTTQDLMREQPTHSGDINLVGIMCDLLLVQCENITLIKRMQAEQIELVCSTLDTLVEVLQGPCVGNQDFIANHMCMSVITIILEVTIIDHRPLTTDY